MAAISIRNLDPQFSFGSRVSGLGWDNIDDPALRADLAQLFKDRGFIVFEDMEPSPKMQVALSTIFGPLKESPEDRC